MTMLSINTNVGALRSSQASYSVNSSMETSMQRLSSGKRINSAADDAAGIQIANRLNAEIQGLNMSVRNAADAQAFLGTAEGALEEVHSLLLRMREIAVQASNGTLQDSDRDSLQEEVTVLEAEIQRISDDTTYAGKSVFENVSTGLTFQIGPRSGDSIAVSIDTINATHAFAGTPGGLKLDEDVTTAARAMGYIQNIDDAISAIATMRGTYGATINRLDHTIANLQNISTNLQTAKGRIEDADFAAETSNLARTQVMQQASMAMLAQANASKQNILSLFQ